MNHGSHGRFHSRISQTFRNAGLDAFDLGGSKARCGPLVLWPRKVRPNGSLEIGDGCAGRGFPLTSLSGHGCRASFQVNISPLPPVYGRFLLTIDLNERTGKLLCDANVKVSKKLKLLFFPAY